METPLNFPEKVTRWIGSKSSLYTHTVLFAISFLIGIFGVPWDKVLLVLTTAVSLEAIYLSILIQMTVNKNTKSLEDVEEDIGEIQKDVDDIQEDVGEIERDVDEIQKDVDEIEKDVDEMEKEDGKQLMHGEKTQAVLTNIEQQLQNLLKEIEQIKKERK